MPAFRVLAAILVAALLAGCAPTRVSVGEPTLVGSLPASFAGDLPCADCPAIRYRLNLFADGAYFLNTTYLGRPKGSADDIGGWVLSSDAKSLMLKGGRDVRLRLAIKDRDTLRLLDAEGREAQSSPGHDLRRTPQFEPVEPSLRMRGMYRHMADAGLFTECLTRQRWPVAQEKDAAALEAAYLKARREPGSEVLVAVEAQLQMRSKPTLVVQQLLGAYPAETCGARFASATLEDTYWRATQLGDVAVPGGPGQRELHLMLQSSSGRAAGFSGCNRFTGAYQLKGKSLTFGKNMASTRMACPDRETSLESLFFKLLDRSATWVIAGEHLELQDADGRLLGRFQARALK